MRELVQVSPYIFAAGLAWAISQTTKYVISIAKSRSLKSFSILYSSGNMPSAHTATLSAMATMIGLSEGVASPSFSIIFLMTCVVAYDAIMVRRACGEQGIYIRKTIAKEYPKQKLPYQALGHKPLEVLVGAALGVSVGMAVDFFITK